MVLKRAALREEVLQCPCEHCSNAVQAIVCRRHCFQGSFIGLLVNQQALHPHGSCQAIHQLQDREILARLCEAWKEGMGELHRVLAIATVPLF